jgi:Txe/YoeB family toxin of Txe-Axe toxin-antitoxin module
MEVEYKKKALQDRVYWKQRRITQHHRIIYEVFNNKISILSLKDHYL